MNLCSVAPKSTPPRLVYSQLLSLQLSSVLFAIFVSRLSSLFFSLVHYDFRIPLKVLLCIPDCLNCFEQFTKLSLYNWRWSSVRLTLITWSCFAGSCSKTYRIKQLSSQEVLSIYKILKNSKWSVGDQLKPGKEEVGTKNHLKQSRIRIGQI